MFKSLLYLGLISLISLCFSCAQNKEVSEKTHPEMQLELMATMQKSHDWMWKNRQSMVGGSRGDWNWTNATWLVGSMELYKISKNPELLQVLVMTMKFPSTLISQYFTFLMDAWMLMK